MKKTFTYLRTLLVGLMAVTATGAWADIDLTGLKPIAVYDFNGDTDLNTATLGVSSEAAGTSYDFGGSTEITVYTCNLPAKLTGKFAFQGVGNAWNGKGWWIDPKDNKAGNNTLLANGSSATRAAAILGIKAGNKVVFQVYDSNANSDFQIKGGSATYSEEFETNEDGNIKEYGVTVTEDGSIGFCSSKYNANGRMGIIKITVYGSATELTIPSITLKSVDAGSKKYTISNSNGSGTLYYTTTVSEDAPEKGDAAYSNTTEESVDVDITESGNLYAYIVDGGNSTEITSLIVDATPQALATPGIAFKAATKDANGYLKDVEFTIIAPNNTAVELQPATETIDYTFTPDGGEESGRTAIEAGGTYTPTGKGILKIYANTTGYVESVLEFPVSNIYQPSYTSIDFSTLDDVSTLSGTWTANDVEAGAEPWSNWATIPEKWICETQKAVLDGRLYIANANTVYLIKGWGITRPEKSYGYSGRYAVSGNIMMLSYRTSTSDNTSVTDAFALATSGTGLITDFMPTITVPADNCVYQLVDFTPSVTSISTTITDAGWATLYTDYALDFTGTGLEAYTATVSENTVTLTPVENVPAGTGVVLKGNADTYEIPVIGNSSTAKGALQGSTSKATTADGTQYVLAMNNEGNAQFAPATSGTIAAGKAYLVVAGGASRLNVVIAGETTGIKVIEAQEAQEGIYNLQGQRVAKAQKGLYIVNGKKAIVK
jgi:hypothetical protein